MFLAPKSCVSLRFDRVKHDDHYVPIVEDISAISFLVVIIVLRSDHISPI